MTIYAIFLCIQMGCRPIAPPSYVNGIYTPAGTYDSLEDCRSAMLKWYGGGWKGMHPTLDANGRLATEAGAWYECLSRHIDTWEDPPN